MPATHSRQIVVRLQDGLGNQLFQYALGRKLTQTNGAELVFDTSWYNNPIAPKQPRPLALREFNVAGEFRSGDEFRPYWIRPTFAGRLWWRVEQAILPPHWRRFIVQHPAQFVKQRRTYDARVLAIRPNAYLAGWWISPRYFAGIEATLRSDLVLREPLSPNAANLVRSLQAGPCVAVHVRRGDYKDHPEIGMLSAAYYANAIAHLKSRVAAARFVVFSDEPTAAQSLLAPILGSDVAMIPSTGSPAVDLTIMAACTHFIIANSTFGWWAAWLASAREKIVAAPKFWYASRRVAVPDVYPTDWIPEFE